MTCRSCDVADLDPLCFGCPLDQCGKLKPGAICLPVTASAPDWKVIRHRHRQDSFLEGLSCPSPVTMETTAFATAKNRWSHTTENGKRTNRSFALLTIVCCSSLTISIFSLKWNIYKPFIMAYFLLSSCFLYQDKNNYKCSNINWRWLDSNSGPLVWKSPLCQLCHCPDNFYIEKIKNALIALFKQRWQKL